MSCGSPANDERMLRVRRLLSSSRMSLAAILPAELLLPQVAPDGTRFTGYARIALADDTVVGAAGSDTGRDLREGLDRQPGALRPLRPGR